MAATLTVDAFLDVIRRSRLVRPEDLERVLQESEGDGLDLSTPKALAQSLVDRELLTRWQADYLLQGKHKGFFLGPYRFLRMLGKGGMGAVYLAQHEMMRRRCAVKVLPAKLLKDKTSVLERFYLEAQAVASLDHPNIVRAYDVNKDTQGGSEIHYLVMEYVEGNDLQTLVQERGTGLDYLEVAEFARQAAQGLAHAHENGLIHRDIKPANLLVDAKGTVKILDLGLARFFDDRLEASLTTAYNESILGTADYLSPEQALNSHKVDTRTDIYSLGCTCYFMLTGQPPFPDGSVAQRLIAHQVKAPAPIERFRPDVPRDLVAIIQKMIAKKPEHRFQSAAEVSEALRSWLLDHADADWKQQHRDAVGEGSGVIRSGVHDPTRARSSAMEDTELGLAPLEDERPVVQATGSDSAVKPPADSSARLRGERKAPSNVNRGSTSAATPAESRLQLTPAPPDDLLSQPLDDILSQPMGDAFGADPLATQPLQPLSALPGTSASGIQRRVAAAPAAGENPRLLLLLLVGLGISLPLALVILFLATYFSAAPPSPHPLPEAQPPAAAGSQARSEPSAPKSETSQPASPKRKTKPRPEELAALPPTPEQSPAQPSEPLAAQDSSVPEEAPRSDRMFAPPFARVPEQAPSQPGSSSLSDSAASPFTGAHVRPDSSIPSEPAPAAEPALPESSEPLATAEPAGPATDSTSPAKKGAKTPTEPSAEEKQRLLASVGDVGVSVTLNRESRSKIAAMVLREAYNAWERAGIPVKIGARKEDPVIVVTTIGTEKSDRMMVLKVAAELRYRLEDGKSVTLWKGDRQVGVVTDQALKREVVPPYVRSNVEDFFNELVAAYREALAVQP